jgi:hypothetical protein
MDTDAADLVAGGVAADRARHRLSQPGEQLSGIPVHRLLVALDRGKRNLPARACTRKDSPGTP